MARHLIQVATVFVVLIFESGPWLRAYGEEPEPPSALRPSRGQPIQSPKDGLKDPAILDAILNDWEAKSAGIKSFRADVTRTVYLLVSAEERVSRGTIVIGLPDRWRMDLVGVEPNEKKGRRLGRVGQQFDLVADRSEGRICTPGEFVLIDEENKSYQLFPITEECSTKLLSPISIFFQMKAKDAKRRFQIEVAKDSENSAVLIIHAERENWFYRKAFVLLDKSLGVPTAVKFFDPSASIETVYKFDNIQISPARIANDVFRPNLKKLGYKLTLAPTRETENLGVHHNREATFIDIYRIMWNGLIEAIQQAMQDDVAPPPASDE